VVHNGVSVSAALLYESGRVPFEQGADEDVPVGDVGIETSQAAEHVQAELLLEVFPFGETEAVAAGQLPGLVADGSIGEPADDVIGEVRLGTERQDLRLLITAWFYGRHYGRAHDDTSSGSRRRNHLRGPGGNRRRGRGGGGDGAYRPAAGGVGEGVHGGEGLGIGDFRFSPWPCRSRRASGPWVPCGRVS
jgi:hypothetical protein